jgi:hypothetical protein
MNKLLSAALVLLAAVTPAFAAVPSDLVGRWYQNGDPARPCFVSAEYVGREPVLTFTNTFGEHILGRMHSQDSVVVDFPSPRGGSLIGRLNGNPILNGVIAWDNGIVWTRAPGGP